MIVRVKPSADLSVRVVCALEVNPLAVDEKTTGWVEPVLKACLARDVDVVSESGFHVWCVCVCVLNKNAESGICLFRRKKIKEN